MKNLADYNKPRDDEIGFGTRVDNIFDKMWLFYFKFIGYGVPTNFD